MVTLNPVKLTLKVNYYSEVTNLNQKHIRFWRTLASTALGIGLELFPCPLGGEGTVIFL